MREDYADIINDGVNRFNKTAQGHQYKEQRELVNNTYKTRANYLTDRIAGSSYDQDEYIKNLMELDNITEEYTRNVMGGDPNLGVEPSPVVREAINAQKVEARSTAVYKTVESLVAAEDGKSAVSVAEKFSGLLTTADTVRVNKLLKQARAVDKTNEAKRVMEIALDKFGDNKSMAADFIGSMLKGDTYKESLSMYENRVGIMEAEEKKRYEENKATVMDELRKNGGYFNDKMRKMTDKTDHASLVEYANRVRQGELIPRNVKTYNMLYDMYLNQPDRFANQVNIRAYQNQLPAEDIRYFEGKQAEGRDPLTSKMGVKVVNDITEELISSEVATKHLIKSDGYKANVAAVRALGDEVLESVKNKLGDRASQEDLRKEYRKEMALKLKKLDYKNGWFNRTFMGGSDAKEPQALNIDKGLEDFNVNQTRLYEGYKPAIVEEAAREFEKRRGRRPTDSELSNVLKQLKQRGHI
jgi:hypothetical protein